MNIGKPTKSESVVSYNKRRNRQAECTLTPKVKISACYYTTAKRENQYKYANAKLLSETRLLVRDCKW